MLLVYGFLRTTMLYTAFDRFSNWNPQLFRELKERLTVRNVGITVAASLLGQFIVWLGFFGTLPSESSPGQTQYCLQETGQGKCLQDAAGNYLIDWVEWWQDMFFAESTIVIFIAIGVGTYLLINNLNREERRGTLDFLRLTPRSTATILTGKMLGVPILVYLFLACALPFHIFSGLSAQISLGWILVFYLILIGGCCFFYSAAHLFSLLGTSGSLQAWLGGGLAIASLWLLNWSLPDGSYFIRNNISDGFSWFSPSIVFPYLVPEVFDAKVTEDLADLQWFYLPLGSNSSLFVLFALANYGVWSYWIWQSIRRRFQQPSGTWLSKAQSYGLVLCFQLFWLGFTFQNPAKLNHVFNKNLAIFLLVNFILLLVLMVALSPHRQTIQDWARYEMPSRYRGSMVRRFSRWQTWLLGEKSPAPVAIAINIGMTTLLLLLWIAIVPPGKYSMDKMIAGLGVFFAALLLVSYALIVQLCLLAKTPKRSFLAAAALAGVMVVPLLVLVISGEKNSILWLFSLAPWTVLDYDVSIFTILGGLVGHFAAIATLGWMLKRQLRLAGESQTKTLLAGNSSHRN